jgi:protein-disulfide isomerase
MQASAAVTRRSVLAGTVGVVGAGCVGGSDGNGDGSQTLDTHPVGQALASQPRLGPDSATATIVAFEDPSCPRCAAFESETVPKIKSELVDSGEAAYVVRTAPLVYPWGEPAIRALEATYARDADAFWALLAHYFDEQDAFDAENVRDRTEAFLTAETTVDGAAVVADVDAGAHDEAVQTDVSAAEAADVSGTPTVFLFRDSEYRTRATGSVSFDFVRRALDL